MAAQYGDAALVQSQARTQRRWTDVAALGGDSEGQVVLVRARVHAVRSKGKGAFMVLRQATATVQVRVCLGGGGAGRDARGRGGGEEGHDAAQNARTHAAPAQAVLFVDDVTVSKGMVKYAGAITR